MSTHFYAACEEHKVYACVGVSTGGHWWSGSGSKDKEGAELAYRFIWEHNFCGQPKPTGLRIWDEHCIDRLEQKSDDWTEIELDHYKGKAQCRICGAVYEGPSTQDRPDKTTAASVCCVGQKCDEDPHGISARRKDDARDRVARELQDKRENLSE